MRLFSRLKCMRCQSLLVQGFSSGSLSVRAQSFVWNELGRCDECRQVHQRLVHGERLLASNGASALIPSAIELELFKDRVVARSQPVPAKTLPWVGLTSMAALAAAALVLIVPSLRRPPAADEGTFVARGTQSQAVLRLFCQSPEGNQVRPLGASGGDCTAGDVLSLGYVSDAPVHLALFGQGGKPLLDATLPKASPLAPLEQELILEGNSDVRLTAVFSAQPLAPATLAAVQRDPRTAAPGVTVRVYDVRVKGQKTP
jgi:hypothetical protein